MKFTTHLYILIVLIMGSWCNALASEISEPISGESTIEFSDSTVLLNEVSVTSIKAVSASQFPSASTILPELMVDNLRIESPEGISAVVPNFYMPAYGSRMTSSIYVRGLGTRIDQPAVALNIDNVPILNKNNYDFDLPDIDRIEMIRGPQSILYGRNSMGGVINIATLSPLTWQGVRASVGYGSGNTWHATAAGAVKLHDKFGISLSGGYYATDGFYRNEHTGRKVDNEHQWLGRVKMAWRPSDNFVAENAAWIVNTRQGGYPYESVETGLINHNDTCFYRRTSVFDGLTLRYYHGNFSLSSITSFQYLNDNMTLDQDFLPEDYFTLTQRIREYNFTQDFVTKGHVGNYSWLGGLFGFYRHSRMTAPVTFHDYGISSLIEANINAALPPAMGMQLRFDDRNLALNSDFRLPLWGLAAYHKSEYRIGRFTAALGLRLAFERAEIDYHSYVNSSATMWRTTPMGAVAIATQPIAVDIADRLHQTSLQLLPELKLSYAITPEMGIGAIISKGYKAGGYNTQMFSDILQQKMMASHGSSTTYDPADVIAYKPEYSWNYEVDFTARFPAIGLSLDAAAFYIDCHDQQMTVFPEGSTTGRVMTNAGRTRSIGFELSAVYTPIPSLRFIANYGLADARFVRYFDGKVDCRGNHVPYAPTNTLFASATYTLTPSLTAISAIDFSANVRGVGKIEWNEENTLSQPFYATLGASITIHSPIKCGTKAANSTSNGHNTLDHKELSLQLWTENLTGTRYNTFYFVSIGHPFLQRALPRTFGATLRLSI